MIILQCLSGFLLSPVLGDYIPYACWVTSLYRFKILSLNSCSVKTDFFFMEVRVTWVMKILLRRVCAGSRWCPGVIIICQLKIPTSGGQSLASHSLGIWVFCIFLQELLFLRFEPHGDDNLPSSFFQIGMQRFPNPLFMV